MAAGLALLLIAPRFHERSPLRSVVTASMLLCVFGGVVAQLIQDNDSSSYLRVLLPFILFLPRLPGRVPAVERASNRSIRKAQYLNIM